MSLFYDWNIRNTWIQLCNSQNKFWSRDSAVKVNPNVSLILPNSASSICFANLKCESRSQFWVHTATHTVTHMNSTSQLVASFFPCSSPSLPFQNNLYYHKSHKSTDHKVRPVIRVFNSVLCSFSIYSCSTVDTSFLILQIYQFNTWFDPYNKIQKCNLDYRIDPPILIIWSLNSSM